MCLAQGSYPYAGYVKLFYSAGNPTLIGVPEKKSAVDYSIIMQGLEINQERVGGGGDMKRCIDLIMLILEHALAKETDELSKAPHLPDYSPAQVHYHIGLCSEAGLLHVKLIGSSQPPRYHIGSLTWQGQLVVEHKTGIS